MKGLPAILGAWALPREIAKMPTLSQIAARDMIAHLKAGTTPLDLVRYINVGNERWYEGCRYHFEQVEQSADSRVRFIRGFVGDGKTHVLGMLRLMALERQWAVGYVSAETTSRSRGMTSSTRV